MLPTANILDQLLGGFDVKSTGVSGVLGNVGATGATGISGISAEGNPLGLIFGDLLMQVVEGADGVAKSSQQQQLETMFPSIDQPLAQEEAPAGPTVERNFMSPGAEKAILPDVEQIVPSAPKKATLLIDPTIEPEAEFKNVDIALSRRPDLLMSFPRQVADGLPVDPAAANKIDALSLLPADPKAESVVYSVLDSKVSDGRLELTVTAEGQAKEPVKISLPATLLAESPLQTDDKIGRTTTGRPSRVPIEGFGKTTNNPVDDLLARLNLKTLEIKAEPDVAPTKTDRSPVQITLVADNDGAQVALKGKLAVQDIQVRSTRKSSDAPHVAQTENKNTFMAEPTLLKPVTLDKLTDPLRRHGNLMDFNLTERFGNTNGQNATPTSELTASTASIDRTPATDFGIDRKLVPAVKMTLPETIQKPFAANGQTLMIRIEPDHLGPARLSLSVRDHMLTARVMVETPMARMAVQNSLDQLTDQLSRAGIDVDRIEVSLSGDDARQQFLDRRPAWSHARRTRRFEEDLETGPEVGAATQVVTAPPPHYVGADSVNLLA